ncbi:T-cell-interacting, activating receptor on myeloid cells protein 1-like isoform X2 [Macrotis lagotis]|uniref:T-cell-interacting, activating receptor on myeloid cells protein 1-like isoform X2 n=1 Tax=Macrotis lagotis TaxID=92651 RepID=UPI003D691386
MHSTKIVLLCLGLCLYQEIKALKETLSKPTIWAKPSSVVEPGTDVTLHCWTMQSTPEEMTITLLKSGMPVNEQQAEKEAKFFLPSVSITNAGSYSCFYSDKMDSNKKSVASDTLDLVVTGSLPKPSFLAHPSPKVALGGSVILRCILPLTTSSLENIMFILLKTGNPEPVHLLKASKRWVEFPLHFVRVQDAGLYRCIYYEKKAMPKASEPSESLNICLTDFPIKPYLTVQPSSNVSLGGNMRFHCQASACGIKFTLYKEGEEMPIEIVNSSQDKAEFFINAVNKNHAGSYRCHYHTGGSNSTTSIFSDPLELLVTDEEALLGKRDSSFLRTGTSLTSGNILITILSCISILLFLVLLSYYLNHIMVTGGRTPSRDVRQQSRPWSLNSIHPVISQEVVMY